MSLASLEFHERSVPLGALACAELGGLGGKVEQVSRKDVNPKDPPKLVVKADGTRFEGAATCLRYFARAGSKKSQLFLDGHPVEGTQIDQWIDWSVVLKPGQGLPELLKQINAFVSTRTYLVGGVLTLADVAIWGTLASMPLWVNKLKKDKSLVGLVKWYDTCSAIPEFAKVLSEQSKPKKSAASADGKKADTGGSFEIKLTGAVKGKVVTRFPPEPSGYLHIGHAKACLLNQYFAQHYEGKLLLRFDDTNPSKEKDEFVENILQDLKSLGIEADQTSYTSDHFPQLLDLAEKMIKKGFLYADDTPVEKMREERMEGINSVRRDRSVEENLKIFKEMQDGTEEGQKHCIRVKLDMQNLNKALRDPVCFRCNLTPHHRTGTTYKVYPTYDFACPFVDSFEGVTHALRTNEYKDREDQFQWILKLQREVLPKLPKVNIWEFSRLNMVNTVMSKRKLQWFVDTGKVSSWTDPRFPTVQGLLRRGLTVPALRDFILQQGASKNTTNQSWDKIWTLNKKLVDPVCARHTAVISEKMVPVELVNGPAEPQVETVLRHKKNPATGKKSMTKLNRILIDYADAKVLSKGEEVTFMSWGNCFIEDIKVNGAGEITGLVGKLNPGGDFKTTKLKLTWLADIQDNVNVRLVYYDHLITKKKIEEGDNFEDLVNTKSKVETMAIADGNCRNLQKSEIIQFERKGYFIVDEPYMKESKPIVLNYIPDGRTKGK
ncbi:glutamate--tRNA ligase [Chloropicon primus]|uniref:glutamate--tRNA ligase n=1 Tax=Chloropicon primus TaxID=1764295 RepID=A0A5B8MJT8_9CHLO|nr:glutamate--tRNA ligase [Chloropicon primus]UPQ99763.1 glutamate--tRNA ligase [Chloropicon primus]|mmetsp:Transcript_3668/g.10433  ORF Transcript_3668/g.10433 Transcript_3668/m.10433 type:complete len:720 (-) Transcript_3668:38-2197(-)|eukprot:QDZ20551.1 glutamate--tRNA ligase [Chloropicon primus]